MSKTVTLPRSTPESQGISSRAVLKFVEAVEAEIHYPNSMMLIKHGHVVAEGWWRPYAAEARHMLFSLSKSFASTAVGLAVGEGLLSIEDAVISFFPDALPAEVSPNLAAMKVKHLLCMSTGHDVAPTFTLSGIWPAIMQLPTAIALVHGTGGPLPKELAEADWVAEFLATPVVHEPGTFFVYNTAATYMLSAIVQRSTGLNIHDYLRPRLFEPLGIADPLWQESAAGSYRRVGAQHSQRGYCPLWPALPAKGQVAGAPLAGARMGGGGRSAPEPQLPARWPDWQAGYGYQFWRCRHNVYRADGRLASSASSCPIRTPSWW
jgi:CubicO group peptidase (beta-lactamase class C family)